MKEVPFSTEGISKGYIFLQKVYEWDTFCV